MCFDLCRCFAARSLPLVKDCAGSRGSNARARAKRRFKAYSFYAWGVPAATVTLGHLLDNLNGFLDEYRPGYATTVCWLNNRQGLGLFLALPFAALMLENAVFFFVALASLCQQQRMAAWKAKEQQQQQQQGKDGTRKVGIGGVKFRVNDRAAAKQDAKKVVRFLSYVLICCVILVAWTSALVAIFVMEGQEAAAGHWLWYIFIVFDNLAVRI